LSPRIAPPPFISPQPAPPANSASAHRARASAVRLTQPTVGTIHISFRMPIFPPARLNACIWGTCMFAAAAAASFAYSFARVSS